MYLVTPNLEEWKIVADKAHKKMENYMRVNRVVKRYGGSHKKWKLHESKTGLLNSMVVYL